MQFKSLTLGYQNTTGSETIYAFWETLRSRALPLYPGEGDHILSILAKIEHYQYKVDPSDLHVSTEALIRIIDRILTDESSILSQQVRGTRFHNLSERMIRLSFPESSTAPSNYATKLDALLEHRDSTLQTPSPVLVGGGRPEIATTQWQQYHAFPANPYG